MIYIIDHENAQDYGGYLMQMHRKRYDIFVKVRRSDELESFFEMEIDQYDSLTASYLLIVDEKTVIASVRVMPTMFGTFLGDEYVKWITAPEYPRFFGAETWEMFRLFVHDTEWRSKDGHPATRILMVAMYDYLIEQGAKRVVAVSDSALLNRLPSEWVVREIGERIIFEQQGGSLGESALVEIELTAETSKITRANRNYFALEHMRAEEGLKPYPSKITPPEVYAVNCWLEHHPGRIVDARNWLNESEYDQESCSNFKILVAKSLQWSLSSTSTMRDRKGRPVWH
jgi:N-acyl-L-homoserine lactone synthetase